MKKEKSLAFGYVLAFFLGGIGAHLFYYRKYVRGILYLLFCWTYIPIFLGWIDMLFVKKWTNQINSKIHFGQSGSHDNISEYSTEGEVSDFSKGNFTFYEESEIILPEYSHLKADKSILAHLKNTDDDTIYEKDGIRLTLTVSNNSSEFIQDSLKYALQRGYKSKEIPFQTYWPTFRDLDERQLKWYFYWREQVLKGNYLEVDLSYIFMFVYELLNYSFNQNAAFNVSMLVRLLDNYKETYPELERYLRPWIADMLYELGEANLAKEWDNYNYEYVPKLYEILQEATDDLEKISISVWKPYISNYRETVFFQKHRNKIYKKFKQSIPLLYEAYQANGTNLLLNEWFELRDSRKVRDLFRSAVVERVDRQIHVKVRECRPTEKLYDVVTNLFRLAENVVRIEVGEKRQIKVNEEVLPPGMKEKMLALNKRFKTVQSKDPQTKGSSIPDPPKEFEIIQEYDGSKREIQDEDIRVEEIEFDWHEINQKEEELRRLYNKIEAIEFDEEEKVDNNKDFTSNETAPVKTDIKEISSFENENNFNQDDDIVNSMFADEDVELAEFVKELTDIEKQFLLLFEESELSSEQVKEFAKNQGKMPGVLITEINEKANEYLDDILLEENEDSIEILEEFEEIVSIIRGEKVEN